MANRILPWLVALAYLAFIASLGWKFHGIERYRIAQMSEERLGQSSPIKLGLVRVNNRYPQSAQLSLTFATPADGARWSVFVPRSNSDLRLSVNDFPLQLKRVSHRKRGEYLPLLVPIPPQLLVSNGPNQLNIDLQANSPAMVLSKFYLGPQTVLEPVYRVFHFFRQELMHGATAVTALLAVFLGVVYLARRRFVEYGLLAIAFLAFAYYLTWYLRRTESLYPELLMWSALVGRALFIWAFMVFVHMFVQKRRRRLEYLVGGFFGLVFTVGLVLISSGRYVDFINLTYVTSLPAVLLVIAYTSTVMFFALWRSGHVYLHWLLAGGLLGLLLGIHDVCVLFNAPHWLIRDFYISHYAIVFTAVGYGGVLVHRVAEALLSSEDMNVQLNQKLTRKSAELEQASQHKIATEKQLALAAERQRIMADMHDGVGGQLVCLMAANRSGQLDQATLTAELEQILADLRLVLDALTPAGEELIAALARLRERYTPLLERAGITLLWSVDSALDEIALPPSQIINVLRVVQEAIQNAVKHADANQIRLSLVSTQDGYQLSIRDNGSGPFGDRVAGHGTNTLQQRALALGGKLALTESVPAGTTLRLQFPRHIAARP